MPKAVMSGTATAPAPAAPATKTPPAAPAAASVAQAGEDPRISAMRSRLEGMKMAPKIIQAALIAERKKLGIAETQAISPAPAPAPAPALAPAPAPAPAPTPVAAPPAPAEKAAPVAQAPAKPVQAAESMKVETGNISDEEYARQLAEAYGDGSEELPPEEPSAQVAPARAASAANSTAMVAAADVGHEDDEGPGAMVVRNAYSDMSGGALSGPIDRSDFKTPQIKLVQGSGPLSQKFNQGTLIFLDIALFPAPEPGKEGPPLNFVPVSIQKYFRENLARDPVTGKGPVDAAGNPVQPRNVATFEEVQRLGGTTEFTVDAAGNRIKPTWSAAAKCTLIIERPEGNDNPGFTIPIEIGGKTRVFAPAIMFVNGGQYRSFVKPIIDATAFILSEGSGDDRRIVLEKRVWKMQVVKEKSGENMVFNPKVTMLPELASQDLRDLAKSLRG